MLRHACGYKLAKDGVVAAGLLGTPQYPEHHALYGAGAGSVQGLLAGLTALEGVTRVCRPVVDDSAVSSGRELQCLRLYREQE